MAVFYRTEVAPLQRRFLPINDWLGQEVVSFKPYKRRSAAAAVAGAGAAEA